MDEFMLDGAHAEIERLAALHQSRKPLYSDRFLSHQAPGTEDLGAPQDAQLSHDDLLAAWRELAEQHGVSSARVRGTVMLTTAQAGLGYSEAELAAATREVALAMDAGAMKVSDEAILKLSRLGDDTFGLASDPIPDAEHLKAAAVLCRSGHGDWPAAAIAKRARELGVPNPLESALRASPDTMQLALSMAGADTGETAALAGTTQETRARRLAAGGQDSASAVIDRHPELAYLFRAGKTSSRRHPRRSDRMVTTDSRAHSSDTGDEDTMDRAQPARGGKVHAKVRELIEANPHLFTDGEGRDPSAASAWPAG